MNPDPTRVRIRNPAGKGEKAACYLAEILLLDHELDLLEGEAVLLDPDPDPQTRFNPDPGPQPCQKGRKSCCYLAELLLLDHELDLVEGEGVLLQAEVQISQPEDVVVVQDQLCLLTK